MKAAKESLELETIENFINRCYGLEFSPQQQGLFVDAVKKRLAVSGASSTERYGTLLQQNEEEALALLKLLTVHETYFFREPAQLETLGELVLPRLARNGPPLVRMLSAGCSSGEEAYSMAMAAMKLPGVGRDWDFEVIGVDVDLNAIRKARAGIYGAYSFRGCPEQVKSDFFQALGNERFAVRREVKRKVRFETLNLFSASYPEWMEEIDVVFYRNVSIYFSQEQRMQLFKRLASLLKNDGCLFLSCTETLYHNTELLALVKNGETFYYRKEASSKQKSLLQRERPAANITAPILTSPLRRPVRRRLPETKQDCQRSFKPRKTRNAAELELVLQNAKELVQSKQYDAALSQLDEIISAAPDLVPAITLKANLLLDRAEYEVAKELCLRALEKDFFCLEAYLLLGMGAKAKGENDDALRHFKEALYVSPECWLAHFFLAELYSLSGEDRYARREYEVTADILSRSGFAGHGLSVFQLSFQKEDVISLCQHNMKKLRE